MNTKQKLTLGIAAIFMVTLTIIGVTYAYFVTRVNYTGTETTAVIKTAEIGSSLNIKDAIVLENAIPGQSVYKAFSVTTGSASDVPFSILITSSLNVDPVVQAEHSGDSTWTPDAATDALPEFVHSKLNDETKFDDKAGYPTNVGQLTGTCYMSEDAAKAYTSKSDINEARANCYNDGIGADGNVTLDNGYYDNIELTLYRVYSKDVSNTHTFGNVADNLYYENVAASTFGGVHPSAKFPEEVITGEEVVGTYTGTYNGSSNVELGKQVKLTNRDGLVFYADVVPMLNRDTDGKEIYPPTGYEENILAPYNRSFVAAGHAIVMGGTQAVLAKKDGVDSSSYNLYVLKVTYKDIKKNQNIENEASLNIKIDISGNAQVTN